MIRDEGVIKFQCRFQKGDAPAEADVQSLILYRQRLYELNLIGVYPDGIGFGNISTRRTGHEDQFIISSSQTGHLETVTAEHFATVTRASIDDNWVECLGLHAASSESLTHAMIYNIFDNANAVIHVHDHQSWPKLLGKVPTSDAHIPYGTKQMAWEIDRLAKCAQLADQRVFVMAGHEGGILSFGDDLETAFDILMRTLG